MPQRSTNRTMLFYGLFVLLCGSLSVRAQSWKFDLEPGSQNYFSVALPEGNYKVTITLGRADGDSLTTVKAELRRLMLENVATKNGKFVTCTFTVNVRTPQIAGNGEVKLKERETNIEAAAWDNKLT